MGDRLTHATTQQARGLNVATVLDRAELSTRAFYRHFDSKDQFVGAVFLEMARAEKRRLQRKMARADDPAAPLAPVTSATSPSHNAVTPTQTSLRRRPFLLRKIWCRCASAYVTTVFQRLSEA